MKPAHAPAPREPAPPTHSIGLPRPLVDGVEKVSGRALYTADLPFPGALVGRIGRSPVAHGLIRRIDASRALALPGVHAVVTGADFAAPYGVIPIAQNEWPLARERVRYRGEPLFAVAADDARTAQAALAAVEVEIDPLPAYFDADAARAPDAVLLHDNKPGNLERRVEQDFGDVDAGFAAADLVLERDYDCAEVAHGQIELNATVAQWDAEREQLTVHSVTQVPYYLHLMLAQTLGLDSAAVRVVKPFVGGGFGHRVEPLNFEMVTAALARAAGGTVKLELTREETFLTHRGRPATQHPAEDRPHEERRDHRGRRRGGAARRRLCRLRPGDDPLRRRAAACAVPRGRGALSRLSRLHQPAALRRDARPRRGERALRLRVAARRDGGGSSASTRSRCAAPTSSRRRTARSTTCRSIPTACRSAWTRSKRPRAGTNGAASCRKAPGLRRGLGMACSHYVSGSAKPVHWSGEPHAVVILKLDFDGGITILTGAADIGQGSSTLLTQVVAEVLLLPMARIRVVATDSALTPKDNGSYSSRVSFMVGNAALRAAEALKRVLVEAAARRLEVAADDIEWLGESCARGRHRPARCSSRRWCRRRWSIPARSRSRAPGRHRPRRRAASSAAPRSARPPASRYGAQVVEVEVDEDTGAVRVLQVWSAHDCGRALNPLAVQGQVQGAVWMGLGQALGEETQYHEGLPLRANFIDYRIPTIVESPPIAVTLVESIDPLGPFGAKEASEGGLHGVPPALAAAVHDAIGLRLHALPITPDRVLEALQRAPARRTAGSRAGAARAAGGGRRRRQRGLNTHATDRRIPTAAPDHGGRGRQPAAAPRRATGGRRHRPAAQPAARPASTRAA